MQHSPPADLIGSAEAAQVVGVDRATFNRWVKAGRVTPAVAFPGTRGARLFRRSDIEALAAQVAA